MIIRFAALFAILSVGLPSAALADDLKAAATKVSDCRLIEDDGARLACLDAAALALSLALDADQRVEPEIPVYARACTRPCSRTAKRARMG